MLLRIKFLFPSLHPFPCDALFAAIECASACHKCLCYTAITETYIKKKKQKKKPKKKKPKKKTKKKTFKLS